MDEELDNVDQADTDPSDNEETNIEGSGAFDPVTGAEAGAYDQPNAGRAPPVETGDGTDAEPWDMDWGDDPLTAQAAAPDEALAPPAQAAPKEPWEMDWGGGNTPAPQAGKEPWEMDWGAAAKPGADDDNQFRGYIPTALRKAVQGFLNINIPVEKGLARLIFGDEDNGWYQNAEARGKNVQGFVDNSALRTTRAENESITGRAAETLGNLAPLFLLGGGLAGVGAASLQMGASGVEAGAQRAKTAGATKDQQYQQGLAEGAIGVGVGAATMGAATLLKPFARSGPGMMNWAQTTLKEAAREGVVFGTAMEAQEYLGEQAAKAIYDPKAEYHFDMVRFLSGLAAGGAIGGTRGAFQRYRPGNPTTGEAPPPDMAPPEGTPETQRQEAKGAPLVNNSEGTAHENVKASKIADVGNPQSTPGSDAGNDGRYAKPRWAERQERKLTEADAEESKTGVVLLENGEVAPDVKAALEPLKRPAKPAPPEPTGEPPAAPRSSDSAPPPAEVTPRPEAPLVENRPEPVPEGVAPKTNIPEWEQEFNRKHGSGAEDYERYRRGEGVDPLDDPNNPHYEPNVDDQGLGERSHGERLHDELKEGLADFWTGNDEIIPPQPAARPSRKAPTNEARKGERRPDDFTYQEVAGNHPLKETPSPESHRSEITSQRAPEGSTGIPEAVTRPVTTAERETLPPVEPQARPTPDHLVEPAAAPAPAEAPRKPRILEDLTSPHRDFVPFQGQREEAPAKVRVEERPRVEQPEQPREGAAAEYQLQKGQYPIKDAAGRVIGGHKMEAEARKLTNRLKKAGEFMNGDRFPFEGEKFDPRKPQDMKAYRDRAVKIIKAAEEEGWKDYFPKQKVVDKEYREAPPEAIFMKEMLSLAKKPFNLERSAETLGRELDLRMGPEGIDAVRAQRREAGNEYALRKTGKLKEFDDTKQHTEAEPDEAEKWLQENDDTWSKHLNRTLADC